MGNFYETDEQLGQYLDFHYGPAHFGVPNFPCACARHCLSLPRPAADSRALDLGCAVGRATFELARGYTHVTGVDLSQRFVEAARTLATEGRMNYHVRDEGELTHTARAELGALALAEMAPRVSFHHGDAGDLAVAAGRYDLVFAGNLIDRLAEPARFLRELAQRLVPGGYLVIASPYTLLEAFTPRENWIGGYHDATGAVTMRDGLNQCLAEHFSAVGSPFDLSFVIRETRRKYQHSVAEVTTWQRR